MFVYLYTNKILLWFTVALLFIGIIIFTIILYRFVLSIIERQNEKEMKKLLETLSPYEFESTQLYYYANKKFNFVEYIYSGDYVKVIKTFKDYYGFTHSVGEMWYFACLYFLDSEYKEGEGDILYISTDKINISTIYLEDREDRLYTHPEEYFKIIEQGRFKRGKKWNL